MATQSGRKPKSEAFAYSWFMPAPGSEGQKQTQQAGPMPEPYPDPERLDQPLEIASAVQTRAKNAHSRPPNQSSGSSLLSVTNFRQPRFLGILGWSGVAGIGLAEVLIKAGPFPGIQVGALGGVWLAISALIWFLPSKLGA